ncbi:MAG: putative quinol monooxygenase [Pseudomonadota bacterium]|nr:putative quinol monooxygenase [Pseudomonadota bacterium]
MSKVTLQGYIVVSDDDLAAVQAELLKHIELTRKEEGCLVFRVTQDKENKNTFTVYEEFVNREAFESHQQRVKRSQWGEITANVERHYQISESR